MIFTKLVIENYGLFEGRHEFDLRPRFKYGKTRPIILFGGKNGSGKTTFLDAIRLILYGRRSLGERLSQKEFEDALLSRLHRSRSSTQRAQSAKLGISFEHVSVGEKHEYYVERSWINRRGDKLDQFFIVTRNGEPLTEVGPAHWEAFVSEMVPERLSQLFFFDGEKIKRIADDISGNAAISDAIQTLLGLDAVTSLKADLQNYKARILKDANPAAYDRENAENERRLAELSSSMQKLEDDLASMRTQIDGVVCSLGNLETRISERGGGFADQRNSNRAQIEELKKRISHAEAEIRDSLEGSAAFVLCPTIGALLLRQIEADRGILATRSRLDEVSAFAEYIRSAVRRELKESHLADYVTQVAERYAGQFTSNVATTEVHQLSPADAGRIEDAVRQKAPAEAKRIRVLVSGLEGDLKVLQKAQTDFELAPSVEDLKDLVKLVSEKNQELGALREKEQALVAKRNEIENEIALVRRSIQRLSEKIAVSQSEAEKLNKIDKLGPALDLYRARLTSAKITVLQSEVAACFNRLARKTDFVKDIRIDPNSFAVSVLDEQGRALPKEELSSGEKQIFAISMLWGLARTSGRPLPVVVDTPLGRLDSDHRANLIQNYFPHAGHQVILLSTDTEVDQQLFQQLSPAVSHSYHLQYDHATGRTNEKEEYFWRE